MAAEYDKFFREAVEPGRDRLAAGFCFVAANRDGTKRVQKAYGTTTISETQPFPEEPFIWVASLTKLVTTIAVLQCVDQGLFSLDDPKLIESKLPELCQLEVISAYDADKGTFTYESRSEPITLRMLLNHTNGCGYDAGQPSLLAWRASRGEVSKWICGDLLEAYGTPLVAQPGTAWNYSPGCDWAGLLIERTLNLTLGEYFGKHIFRPLGMENTLFDENKRFDLASQLIQPTRRTSPENPIEDGAIADHVKPHCKDHFGGGGLYSTPSDYLKILSAVLRQESSLLRPETWALIHRGSLSPQCKETFNGFISIPFVRPMLAMGLPDGQSYDFSLGACVIQNAIPGIANAGCLGWISVTNSFWWIDPKSGYCAAYFQQLHPTGDLPSDALRRKVREYMWSEFGGH